MKEETEFLCPAYLCIGRSVVRRSQRRIEPCLVDVKSSVPSELRARDVASPIVPGSSRVFTHKPLRTSQKRTVPSRAQEAMSPPLGVKRASVTAASCPLRVCTTERLPPPPTSITWRRRLWLPVTSCCPPGLQATVYRSRAAAMAGEFVGGLEPSGVTSATATDAVRYRSTGERCIGGYGSPVALESLRRVARGGSRQRLATPVASTLATRSPLALEATSQTRALWP
mmetsp:Transcript_33075/g.95788  ORF Transcript_33075/g.95788 Transcript_33075/m.95788 type:complete len:227 (-) Transcript_33075:1401-2081(-)